MYSLGGKALTKEDKSGGFINVVLEWFVRSVSKEDCLYCLHGSFISISDAFNSYFFRVLTFVLNALSESNFNILG